MTPPVDIKQAVIELYRGKAECFENAMRARGWSMCYFETDAFFSVQDFNLAHAWANEAREPLLLLELPSRWAEPTEMEAPVKSREGITFAYVHDNFLAGNFALTTPRQSFIMLHLIEEFLLFAPHERVERYVADADFRAWGPTGKVGYDEFIEAVRTESPSPLGREIGRLAQIRPSA